jgi:hypothetical protein
MPDELNIVSPSSDEVTSSSTTTQQGAEALEDEQRLAGNVRDADDYNTSAASDNPDGATAFGAAEDNTPVEEVPPPSIGAVAETTPIPGTVPPDPSVSEAGGGGGDLVGGETPDDVVIAPNPVPQSAVGSSDPTLAGPELAALTEPDA